MLSPVPLGAICTWKRSAAGKVNRTFGVKEPAPVSVVVTSTELLLLTKPVTLPVPLHEVAVKLQGPTCLAPAPSTSALTQYWIWSPRAKAPRLIFQ